MLASLSDGRALAGRKTTHLIPGLVLGLVLMAPLAPQAATLNFDTSSDLVRPNLENQGFWRSGGTSGTDGYIFGDAGASTFRSFFSFKLTGLAGKVITGLELQLRRYSQSGSGTATFFDVTTPLATLMKTFNGDLAAGIAVHDDLGGGNSYGSGPVGTGGASTDVLSFVLNTQAVTDANAALGEYFSIGAALASDEAGNYFGSGSGAELTTFDKQSLQRLVVTYADAVTPPSAAVPVPAALPMLGAGVAMLFALRRRKKA